MMSRSIVVQDDPRRRRRNLILQVLAAIALFVGGLALGGYGRQSEGVETGEENTRLRQRIVSQARQLDRLQQQQIDNETRREIDRNALELVRQELATQQETIAELERGIHFYRSLMAPAEQEDGLSVRSIDIKPTGDRKFLFRILVQQSARKHELLTGDLQIDIEGELEGEPMSYNLSQLSDQVPNPDIRLRFKYFQAIDGELELPAGFSPHSISASARSATPRRAAVEREFPWSVQEEISHVGQ